MFVRIELVYTQGHCDENFYKELIALVIMKKLVGYVVAITGLVVMALGFGIVSLKIAFLEGVAKNYIIGAGIVMILVGAFISLRGGRRVQKEEEVPIYEGEKIVGYRKS